MYPGKYATMHPDGPALGIVSKLLLQVGPDPIALRDG
jgi:hypothetical protein